MPIIQRPYVPPEDKLPQEENLVTPGESPQTGEPITFYSDSMHISSSLYSSVLFFGEQLEEREPVLRARIKVSPQMLKAIALLATKHVREYEAAVGPILLPEQVLKAWDIEPEKQT
jgi:hypothetical protein